MYKSRRNRIILTCRNCDTEFEARPSEIKNGRKFCSIACVKEYRIGENAPNWRGGELDRICKYCGNSFSIRPYKDREGKGIYCSKECWQNDHSIDLTCIICGKVFHAGKARKNAKFCSISCRAEYGKQITGKDHPLYNRVATPCKICGKIVQVQPYQIKLNKNIYCSTECGQEGKIIQLAQGPSDIEVMLMNNLDAKGIKYEFQYPISPWTIDFAFPQNGLLVEADGVYWHSKPEVQRRDQAKDIDLKNQGWIVLHFTGDEIRESPSKCVDEILKHL